MTLRAYNYRGLTYLKFGHKNAPGVLYSRGDVVSGERPAVELWSDGTVTFHDRPEGMRDLLRRTKMPDWGRVELKRFKSRS